LQTRVCKADKWRNLLCTKKATQVYANNTDMVTAWFNYDTLSDNMII